MSSEAAQKAYPNTWRDGREVLVKSEFQVAFDRGAVEALRQAAADIREAYSEVIFRPLGADELTKAHKALTAIGMSLDVVSAQVMRFAADSLEKRADEWAAGQ